MNKMATWPLYTYFYFNGWILTPPENGVTLLPFALAFDFVLVGELQFSYIDLLKLSSFFTYHQGLTFKNSTWCSLCFECFVRISEQTATFALYIINWLVFITVVESVNCAVRTDSLYTADYVSSFKG